MSDSAEAVSDSADSVSDSEAEDVGCEYEAVVALALDERVGVGGRGGGTYEQLSKLSQLLTVANLVALLAKTTVRASVNVPALNNERLAV